MEDFFKEVKEVGVGAAISNVVVGTIYGVKANIAIAKSNLICARRKADMERWEKESRNEEEKEGGEDDECIGA